MLCVLPPPLALAQSWKVSSNRELMRWRDVGEVPCSVARTLSVVGDRWTLLILRDAFLGTRRFDAFQRGLGIARHRLSDRLRRLVDEGILVRTRYQERPERFEYRLSDKGKDLYPIIISLLQWGDRWTSGDEGPPWVLNHGPCGHTGGPQFMCPGCGEPAAAREYRLEPSAWLHAELACESVDPETG